MNIKHFIGTLVANKNGVMSMGGRHSAKSFIFALFVLMGMLLSPLGDALGQEKRCADLGADCVCSNSLDTPSWVNEESSWWYESNEPGGRCGGVERNGHKVNWIPSAPPQSVVARGMPMGSSVTYVLQINSNNGAGIKLRESFSGRSGRVCARHYVKLSGDYESTGDDQCTNDKQIQLGDYFTAYASHYTTSNGGGFNPTISPYSCRNKWCRLELCIDSIENPTQMEIYYQNLTDGTPERSATIPARIAINQGVNDAFVINGYREGFCKGYRQLSHALLAIWPQPNGQRIGPADEVEGASVPPPDDTNAPASPQGLRLK